MRRQHWQAPPPGLAPALLVQNTSSSFLSSPFFSSRRGWRRHGAPAGWPAAARPGLMSSGLPNWSSNLIETSPFLVESCRDASVFSDQDWWNVWISRLSVRMFVSWGLITIATVWAGLSAQQTSDKIIVLQCEIDSKTYAKLSTYMYIWYIWIYIVVWLYLYKHRMYICLWCVYDIFEYICVCIYRYKKVWVEIYYFKVLSFLSSDKCPTDNKNATLRMVKEIIWSWGKGAHRALDGGQFGFWSNLKVPCYTLLACIGHLGYFIPHLMNKKADLGFKVL